MQILFCQKSDYIIYLNLTGVILAFLNIIHLFIFNYRMHFCKYITRFVRNKPYTL